jgi:hypothetical protein
MKPARYQAQVRMCAAEIQAALPELAKRHPPLILVAALAEHIRGALFLTRAARVCAPSRARAMIQRMQQIAFDD